MTFHKCLTCKKSFEDCRCSIDTILKQNMSEKSSFFETDTGTAKPEQWKKSPSLEMMEQMLNEAKEEWNKVKNKSEMGFAFNAQPYLNEIRNWEKKIEGFKEGRNQTLAQVEKIIDKWNDFDNPNYGYVDKLKEEIKNLKDNHSQADGRGFGSVKSEMGSERSSPDTRKGCLNPCDYCKVKDA